MGILRKNPHEKVKINPIKFWGGVTMLALFSAAAFYILSPNFSLAQNPPPPDSYGDPEDNPPSYQSAFIDPNCPPVKQGLMVDGVLEEADPEAGLVVICGRVMSARIHANDLDGDEYVDYLDTRQPITGATVAVYEADPNTKTGKTNLGNLTHLFTSVETNSQGYFKLNMRGLGPKSASAYVVVYCDKEYKGGQRLNSMSTISNLDLTVDCDPDEEYKYETPYGEVNIVENRASILECTVDVLNKFSDFVTGAADALPFQLSINSEKAVSQRVEADIKEENYDFRYMPRGDAVSELGAGGIQIESAMFESTEHEDGTDGALWANDCVVANGEGIGVSPEGNVVGDADLGNAWMCSSAAMDREYGALGASREGAYLVNTALRFIPEADKLLAWRRVDNRASLKQMNEYPFSATQAFQSMFGNYDTTLPYFPDPEDPAMLEDNIKKDPLAICEDIEASTISYQPFDPTPDEDSVVTNTKLTTSFGMMLSSPGLWKTYEQISAADLDDDYCQTRNGTVYTIGEILGDSGLKQRFARPEMLLPKGSASTDWNTEVTSDSCYQDYTVRGTPLEVLSTEAEFHCRDQVKVTRPEGGVNRPGSVVSTLFATGEIGDQNIFTMMDSPYGDTSEDVYNSFKPEDADEDKETTKLEIPSIQDRPTIVMDIGNIVTGLCGVSEVYNDYDSLGREFVEELASNMHNFFYGNKDHLADEVVGSGTFYSADSLRRDELLNELDSAGWGIGEFGPATTQRDLFDSLLEMAAPEDRVDFSNTNTGDVISLLVRRFISKDGPQKSLGDRQEYEVTARPRYVEYDLNAQSFESFFPAFPSEAGGHANYPWKDIPDGEVCNVWPGVGNDPTGQLRTCRIVQCAHVTKRWLDTNPEVGVQDLRLDINTSDCTDEDKEQVLTEQLDTSQKDEDPKKILGYSVEYIVADLEKAGPYTGGAFPIEITMDAKLEQDDLLGKVAGNPATPMDSVTESAYRFRRAFRSPGEDIKGARLAQNDWEFSKNPNEGGQLYGYDTTGYGFDPSSSGLNSISASPTTFSRGKYKEMVYHCEISFEDMQGNPRPMPDGIGKPVIPTWGPGQLPDGSYDYMDYEGSDPLRYYWKCPVRPFVIGECDTEAFDKIPGGIPEPIDDAFQYFNDFVLEKFATNPELLEAYGFASANTGVPCEILAGIHHMEGANNIDQSVWDGHPINPTDLPMDALTAAVHLLGKLGKPIESWEFKDYVQALDHYNGSGNQNCYDPVTPWCPGGRKPSGAFWGWDHPYPMSWIDGEHVGMYIKYCFDHTLCTSDVEGTDASGFLMMQRPGAIAIAKILNQFISGGP